MLAGVTPGPGPTPPTPTPVNIPYIRGGADGSYIDTGIKPDDTTKVIVWARNWNPTSSFLFGGRNALDNAMFALTSNGNSQTGGIRIDYAGTHSTITGDQFANLSGYHKYELFQGVLKIDDEVIASASTGTFSCNYNLHLFGNNNGGSHMNAVLPIDICACQIYKGGTLVRDFTAVNSPSICLYDAVSDTVFANAGSGSFTYGIFDKNAYVPLQYIECDGSQYFDSGVYGSYVDNIVCKFMPTNTTPQWTGLLGIWRHNGNSSCAISLGTATSGQDNMRCYLRLGSDSNSGTAFNGSTSNKLTNKAVVAVKTSATLTLYNNGSQIGTYTKPGVATTFVTNETMRVGMNDPEDAKFIGNFYHVSYGTSRNYVPAKVNNVAGMYDTYNDVFYPSATDTPFIAGPTL